MTSLNDRAWNEMEQTIARSIELGITVEERPGGAHILDAGVIARGGLDAGLAMARIGMSGLGYPAVEMALLGSVPWLWVTVRSDHLLEACYLSQAAHWQVDVNNYHAMGSGPACLLNSGLNVGDDFKYQETSDYAVLVLESAALPDDRTCNLLAEKCKVNPEKLAIIVAPTSSLAGSVQIAARSLETGLHKLHQLGFDLQKAISGMGRCPVAAPTGSDITSLGKTNDAMMFASQVWLSVQDVQDEEMASWTNRIPSSASPSYGEPFLQTIKKAGGFYAVDPGLFAPAEVTLVNLKSGKTFHAGSIDWPRLMNSLDV
jgi:methenyltetrahydromethanopterin cyclohydrolase